MTSTSAHPQKNAYEELVKTVERLAINLCYYDLIAGERVLMNWLRRLTHITDEQATQTLDVLAYADNDPLQGVKQAQALLALLPYPMGETVAIMIIKLFTNGLYRASCYRAESDQLFERGTRSEIEAVIYAHATHELNTRLDTANTDLDLEQIETSLRRVKFANKIGDVFHMTLQLKMDERATIVSLVHAGKIGAIDETEPNVLPTSEADTAKSHDLKIRFVDVQTIGGSSVRTYELTASQRFTAHRWHKSNPDATKISMNRQT